MSMLAERRHKQKWSLNPRGKWWSEDSNKYGQRMLEKMGWTKGKGLGVNEQGITEYVNTPYKKNTAGIGYDENSEIWVEHQDKFNNLLQQLNENQDTIQKLEKNDSLSEQSMELKSKQSRARMHYKKFTQSKDINKYKQKDLANIFGQKELSYKIQTKAEKIDNVYEQKVNSVKENKNETVTTNNGSMTDYIKHKSNYAKNFSSNGIDNPAIDIENENKQYTDFEFETKTKNMLSNKMSKNFDEKNNYAFDNPCLESCVNSPAETTLYRTDSNCKKSAKKRKKEYESLHTVEMDEHNTPKKLKTEIINGDNKNGFTNPALNLDIKLEEDCNGKEFEVSRAQFGLENCGLDLTDEKSNKKCVTFNNHITLYKYDLNSTKKRKGKATLDKFEVKNKKQKKKRELESITTSVPNGFVNEALDIGTVCEEINDNELNEHKSKKTKRKKMYKISTLETIQESPEQEIIEDNVKSDVYVDTSIVKNKETENIDKKLKKKKNKVKNVTVIDITGKELDFEIKDDIKDEKIKKHEECMEESVNSKSIKKKKKNKKSCKVEKCASRTDISNDQESIKILDKTNFKLQQNYLIMDKDKKATEIEMLPIEEVNKEENIPVENKQKKKKKKSTCNEDRSRNENDLKEEISDKENVSNEQDSDIQKLEKKDKKCKKSKEKDVSKIENSIDSLPEIANGSTIETEKVENVELTHKYSKMNRIVDSIDNIIHSPWNAKTRMSKKMLITLFRNNEILDFPGSNIHSISGYGIDAEC